MSSGYLRLRKMTESLREQPPILEPLLSVEAVAAFLGVPVATLYQWRHKNTGPRSIRVGRYIRYRREDVDRWLERQSGGAAA